MSNLRLTIEFDGTGFHGWQFQPDRLTVQGEVERAVASVVGQPTTVYGCSRTDAGVSARNYVANFHSDTMLPHERWCRALNYHLPPAINVGSVEEVDESFHARHSARGKLYRYRIVRGRSPLRHSRTWELRGPADIERVRRAAREFTGSRDFQPFCQTRDKDGTCTIRSLVVSTAGDEIELAVTGDRFLYKLVRRIVGATVGYGCGRLTLDDIRSALAGREHTPFRTAPAAGLVLDLVYY